MKLKLSLVLALILVVFVTTQCDKKKGNSPTEETPAPSPATGINTVAEIIAANGSAPNTVTVDAQFASTITINGSIIEIPNDAFVTSTGGTVTGVASLTVKTILTKSQIIFSGAGANSSSSKLVSTKGCVKATASQNSQSLRLNPASSFYINLPDVSPAPAPQKKYYAPKVTAVDSTTFWALGTDVADIATRTFTASTTVYHHAKLDSLKWLNVGTQFDSIAPAPPIVAVTVNVDGTKFTKSNTMIFVSFNGSLTVGALFEISNGVFRISNMPQGKGVHIVGIAVINGQYYAATLPTTISSTPINLTMNPVSQATMKSMINALP